MDFTLLFVLLIAIHYISISIINHLFLIFKLLNYIIFPFNYLIL